MVCDIFDLTMMKNAKKIHDHINMANIENDGVACSICNHDVKSFQRIHTYIYIY